MLKEKEKEEERKKEKLEFSQQNWWRRRTGADYNSHFGVTVISPAKQTLNETDYLCVPCAAQRLQQDKQALCRPKIWKSRFSMLSFQWETKFQLFKQKASY